MASKGFISFTVKGGKELDRTLNKMDRRLASKALKGGMKAAMEPVKDEAKRRVPVDTGLLRRSIRIATYGGKGYVGAVVRSGTRKQLKIPQDAKHYYPAYIEYGSQGKLARPFLRSAFAAKKNMVLNRVADDIRKAIERVK